MTTYDSENLAVLPEHPRCAPDGQVRVVFAKNPFNTKEHEVTFHDILEDGDTYKSLVPTNLSALPEECLVTSLNGEIITREEWETKKLTSGDSVILFQLPAGGDDAKMIMRLVLLVAIVYLAPYLSGEAVLGLEGLKAVAFEIGFVIAGSLLVNAILPPVTLDGISDGDFSTSRTYGIDGPKNTSEEGISIPVCYGGFRMGGNVLAMHTRNQGNDQYLYMLLNAGEGIVAGITDIELNDQPIAGFLDVDTQVRLGGNTDNRIDWFEESVSPTAVGVSTTTSFQQRSTGTIDRFRLDFVCPNGLVQYNDDGTRVSRVVIFDIQYKLTTEPTVWTQLYDEGRVASTPQRYLYYGYATYNDAGEVTGTVAQENRGDFREPGDTWQGNQIVRSDGTVVGQGWDPAVYSILPEIRRSQTSAVRFSFYSPQLTQGAYDIRVRRTTVEATDTRIRDAVTWVDLNEIITDPVEYNYVALLGLKIRLTDQLSNLPNVTYYNGGRVIKSWNQALQVWEDAPTKNPAWHAWDMLTNGRYGGQVDETRLDIDAWVDWSEYCETEGLEFQGVYDTNMNMWDALMHVFRAGHARPIRMGTQYSVAIDRATAPSQMFTVGNIVKDSFSQKWMSLADRANEIELNYFDETDRFKRRTVKVYDDAIADGAPQNVANVTMYGIVDPVRAAEEATFMLLNNRLIKSTVSFKAPIEAVAVTIGDVFLLQHDQPDWNYGGRLEAGSTTTTLQSDRLITFQAANTYQALVRYDSITRVTADIIGITAGGRRIALAAPFAGQTNIHRIQFGSIDRRITRIESDAIWVKDSTGLSVSDTVDLVEIDAIETRNVVAATDGDLTAIPLATALPSAPPALSVFMVGESAIVESLWRTTKVTVDKDLNAEITGAEYNADIYNWTPLNTQPTTVSDQSRIVPHVINLSVQESTINLGGILRPVLEMSWDLPPDFEDYGGVEIEMSVDGEGYRFAKRHNSGDLFTSIEVSQGATIDVRVIAMSVDGRFALRSTAPEATGFVISGDGIEPGVPTTFAVAAGVVGLTLSWVNPTDADFAGLDLKRNTTNDEPGATILFFTDRNQVSYLDTGASNDQANYYYWARSVDNDGNTSAWVASTPASASPTAITSGVDATVGYLTNEAHNVPADEDGGNPVFTTANGYFRVFSGSNDITATSTFSVFAADNASVTINTAVDTPVAGQPAGYYEVTGETSAQDVHAITFRAVTVDTITIDKVFTVTKSRGGAFSQLVSLVASGLNFSYDRSTGTPVLIGPASIILTVQEQNTTGATTWAAYDSTGAAITPVSDLLSSITDAGATILESDFASITNNSFVQVTATRNGITDIVSVYELGSGEDGADGGTGPSGTDGLNNATVALYASNTSAVTPPAAFSGTFTYTFATALVSGGTLNGWSQTAPAIAAGEYLWVRQAAAVSATATDDVPSAEFSAAVVIAGTGVDGVAGGDGLNTATVSLYHKNTSTVTPPGAFSGTFTYTFATAVLSGGTLNGWSQSAPTINPGEYLWVRRAVASSTTATDDIVSTEFSSPVVGGGSGNDGIPGIDGLTAIPDFSPGFIGGQTDFLFTLNVNYSTGSLNNGEIRVQGTTFLHPDGTSITPASNDFNINTAYEGATPVGIFYIMYSAVAAETRFGGLAADWGAGAPDDTRFISVVWDSTNGWRARDNSNTFYAFTPLVTDCLIAVCQKTGTVGIDTLVPLISGIAGSPGLSVYYAQVFQRAVSAPATPTADDGSYNFGTRVLTPPTGWSATPPASDGNPLWVSTGVFSLEGITGLDETVVWSAAAQLVTDGTDGTTGDTGATGDPGADGEDGISVYFASVFRRSAVPPSTPAVDDGSYNFATATLTPPTAWFATPPASDGNPLYVSNGAFEAPPGGTDNTVTWSAPSELVSDGADGAQGDPGDDGVDGNSVFYATVFQRAGSAPATPTIDDGSYNFATRTLTPPTGWSSTPPASDGNPLYASTGVFEAPIDGTDNTVTWSAVSLLVSDGADGTPGTPGDDGLSVYFAQVFQRAAAPPSTPAVDDGSYNFATRVLTPPTGWSVTPPASDGNPMYVSTGVFEALPSGTDNTVTWSAPANLVSDGVDGAQGDPGTDATVAYYAQVFQRASSQPAVPTGGSFNFGTSTLTPPAGGWSITAPAHDGNPLYVTSALAEAAIGGTDNTLSWSAVSAVALDGADGLFGLSTTVIQVFQRSASAPATPSGGSYNFGTQTITPPSGWSTSPPASDGNPLYVSTSPAWIIGQTGTDSTMDWTAPTLLVSDGVDGDTGPQGTAGTDGNSVFFATVYRRASSPPGTPAVDDGSYNFGTLVLTPPTGWFATPPASDGNPLYASNGVFEAPVGGVDSTVTWTAPVNLVSDGAAGTDGNSSFVATVYKRSNTTPGTPSVNDGEYNFGTGVLTPPSTWSTEVPDDDGRSLWSTSGLFEISGASGSDSTVTWTAPRLLAAAPNSGLILSSRDWAIPATDPMGLWAETGDVSVSTTTTLNSIAGPFGDYPTVLRMSGNGTNPGWISQWRAAHGYDSTRSYVYYMWVRRRGAAANGFYFGAQNTSASNELIKSIAGTPNTNPYFLSNVGSTLTIDQWYLAVGIIWADGAVTSDQGLAGVYDIATGLRVIDATEWMWDGQAAETHEVRFGFFDNAAPTVPSTDQYEVTRFAGFVMNGLEPSIEAVLGAGAIQGAYRDILFQRNAAAPSTPTGNNPSGWFNEVPSGVAALWQTTGNKDANGNLIGVWSTPQRVSGMQFRGAWSSINDYILHDIVLYQERTYICVQAHTSSNPPSGTNSGNAYWDLLAGKGDPGDVASTYTETIAITGTGPVNLRTLADNNTPAYNGIDDATITYTLATGVTITGSPGGHGIDTGTWPSTPTIALTLQITGTVRGGGGYGGTGGNGFTAGNGQPGGAGGDAIYLQEPMTGGITVNSGGVVQASGGGGGGGGGAAYPASEPLEHGGGGGGGGFPNGIGGSAGAGGVGQTAGANGTTGGGGAGGSGSANAGDGGNGGNVNVNGVAGAAGTGSHTNGSGGALGARGYAIRKNANTATVTNNGTITGTVG